MSRFDNNTKKTKTDQDQENLNQTKFLMVWVSNV